MVLHMALKRCNQCGRDVSNKANMCPSCGAPVKPKGITLKSGCLALLILTILTVLIARFTGMAGNHAGSIKVRPVEPTAAQTESDRVWAEHVASMNFNQWLERTEDHLSLLTIVGEKTNPQHEAFALSIDCIYLAASYGWQPATDGGAVVLSGNSYHPSERKYVDGLLDRPAAVNSLHNLAMDVNRIQAVLTGKTPDEVAALGSSAYRYLEQHGQ